MNLKLPPELAPFAEEIRATARPSLRFRLQIAPCGRTDSKVGGAPYWPEELAYPTRPNGRPLSLLAQLNFAEMPPLPDFPSSGILQFFIDSGDVLLGLNLDNLRDSSGFRVIYHPEIRSDRLRSDFPPPDPGDYCGPLLDEVREYRLVFGPVEPQYLPLEDYRFAAQLPNLNAFLEAEDDDWSLHDSYSAAEASPAHRIGGYAVFTQNDPRRFPEAEGGLPTDYELLFQLDSDCEEGGIDLMWGDAGVGNFFITPEDLKRRDFSRVAFSWDCH